MRNFQQPGRSAVYAGKAAVATSHPLATQAALDMLKKGGNAVDAALTASAVLCAVEPHMTGIGGDCFALYAPAKQKGKVVALNGSGRAPAGASVERYREGGAEAIAPNSAHAVTIPGAIAAWCRLAEDHGTRSMEEILAPAIAYAEDGYPVAPRVAHDWKVALPRLAKDPVVSKLMLVDGQAPKLGSLHRQPRLAETLKRVAREGRKGFYEGAVARDLVARLKELGGVHTEEDFAAAEAEYVEPVSASYAGHDIYECPPNGQGVIALVITKILAGFEIKGLDPVARTHLLAEATKQAYHQRDLLLAEPSAMTVATEELLSDAFADKLRARIDPAKAGDPAAWDEPPHKDTICLSVVDGEGNAISFINSIFHPFGSCIMGPDSGVMLHNRGASFRLIEGHPNAVAPGKRPMHTIIPGLVMKNGEAVMPFGVMGGHYQSTGHADFLTRVLREGLDVQAAIDAPRSFAIGGRLQLEQSFSMETAGRLGTLGHNVEVMSSPLGGAQAIWIDRKEGVLVAGSDPRKDGCALGF